MTEPRTGSVDYLLAGAYHRMRFLDWGDPVAPPVVCVHGLTRNAHDFDPLAEALSADFRVICPDLPGRGGSGWLPDGMLYQPPSYVTALSHLFARLDAPLGFVGTSLGGICGMLIAAAAGQPIRRLVLNDIGPTIPQAALQHIADRIGTPHEFSSAAEAEAFLRQAHASFGRLTDARWAAMARHSVRTLPDGRLALHYDPAIAAPILANPVVAIEFWPLWDLIRTPTLVIRGAESDLLEPATLSRMAAAGAATLTVPECGHAPALMDVPTIAAIRDFLMGDQP